jgi:hypothetical protein
VLSRPQDLELPEVTEGTELEKALMVSCTRSVSRHCSSTHNMRSSLI